jgi:hypothetical protein
MECLLATANRHRDIFIDDSNSHLVVPVTLKYFAEILKIKTQKKFLQKLGDILLKKILIRHSFCNTLTF